MYTKVLNLLSALTDIKKHNYGNYKEVIQHVPPGCVLIYNLNLSILSFGMVNVFFQLTGNGKYFMKSISILLVLSKLYSVTCQMKDKTSLYTHTKTVVLVSRIHR